MIARPRLRLRRAGLGAEERAFLRDARPWGLILFKRNVVDRGAIARADRRLSRHCRPRRRARAHRPGRRAGAAHGAAALAGLSRRRRASRPTIAPEARRLARGAAHRRMICARSGSTSIARRCSTSPTPGCTPSSARAPFPAAPERVAAMGRAVCEGLLAGGVVPVVKHIPGHGRAQGRQPSRIAGRRPRAATNSPRAISRPSPRCATRRWR